MICNKCGAENDDGVKYCSTCGNRLDGKKECPFCHAEIKETSVYCENCGKRVDSKKLCPVCGNEMGENDKFCNACGYGNKSAVKQTNSQIDSMSKTEKVLFYLKNCFALLTMLLALVGIFVIGWKEQSYNLEEGTKSTFSYSIISNYITFDKTFKIIMMTFQILSIVGTAAMITIGLVFFFAKKENVCKYMITSLLLLLLPIALCFSYYNEEYIDTGVLKRNVTLSDPTLAIMVLCFMFVTATLVLGCVENALKDKKSLLPNCFKTATFLLIGVAVLSFGFIAIKVSIGFSDGAIIGSGGVFDYEKGEPLIQLGLSFFIIGLVVTAVCGIFKAFGFDKTSLSLGFVGLAFQIATLICMFYGHYKVFDEVSRYQFNLAIRAEYVAGILVAAIACGLNITHIVLKKKAKNNGLDARLQ